MLIIVSINNGTSPIVWDAWIIQHFHTESITQWLQVAFQSRYNSLNEEKLETQSCKHVYIYLTIFQLNSLVPQLKYIAEYITLQKKKYMYTI